MRTQTKQERFRISNKHLIVHTKNLSCDRNFSYKLAGLYFESCIKNSGNSVAREEHSM